MNLLEKLFEENKKKLNNIDDRLDSVEKQNTVSGFTYGFVECTLAEALQFPVTNFEVRFITNARKLNIAIPEGAGNGTGLPSFYDSSSSTWVDFLGNPIQV